MDYTGIDYINKTPEENANYLFNVICIEYIKMNENVFKRVKKIAITHSRLMIEKTSKSDKERDALLTLAPTWKAVKKELDKLEFETK